MAQCAVQAGTDTPSGRPSSAGRSVPALLRVRTWRSSLRQGFLGVATLVCVLGFADAPRLAANPNLPTLTTVRQVLELSRVEAVKGYPVHLRTIVTYYYGGSPPDLFLHDDTGGIWVNLPAGAPALQAGEIIELTGVTEQPDFAPQIALPQWQVVGTSPLPTAPRVTYGQMSSTHEDGQWVEVEGIVRRADLDPQSHNLLLDISMEGGVD